MRPTIRPLIALVASLALTTPGHATWSIVITNTETNEVAVGTVTCLTNYDLLAIVPVVVVGEGGGAVQAAGDFAGIRRPIIFDGLMNDVPVEEIFEQLENISGHQQRQYGIVDTDGGKITFTGSQNGPWAGGVIGSFGTLHYAVQGNVLAGACVIDAIELTIIGTDGDIPARLMAGMQAARNSGGDGRCSCSQFDPPSCGCPPPDFDKSGHIGGMVVARLGDTDDTVCNANGCADGDYFLRLNVAFQSAGNPDPVAQLQEQFDDWRADLEGRPDANESIVMIDPPRLPPNGVSQALMTITPRDWRGLAVDAAIDSVTVEHAEDSAELTSIGEVIDNGDGTYGVTLTAGPEEGVDRFVITIDDGIRPVILTPLPMLEYSSIGDITGDGAVNVQDLLALLGAWGPCPGCLTDLTGDGIVNVQDLLLLLGDWGS